MVVLLVAETIQTISTDKAPAAIGPYSQATRANGFIFTSGQIPLPPSQGDGPCGSTLPAGIEAQTEQALENLKAVLEAAGSGLDRVVKTTVFLADMNDFAKMNEVYARYFTAPALPARSTVQVAALPKSALVEIEAIALA